MLRSAELFKKDLSDYIMLAWDNEQAFLANFWEWPNYDQVELLEFYMADTTCKLLVINSDGKTLTTTINANEYFEWCHNIISLSA